jgi:hypothetical protein
MQEATTFGIFYDGMSFQHLATVLISLFTLCYGPGLLIRGPPCTKLRKLATNWCENKIQRENERLVFIFLSNYRRFLNQQAYCKTAKSEWIKKDAEGRGAISINIIVIVVVKLFRRNLLPAT